ncbi:MAG TPA: F0F1 ATP synthase subunit alpha, partial [Rudaea sp.]|nr:F0F1 ATP synthase subunit alpha [Rudaea sp.]
MATTLNPSEISELIRNRIEKVKLAAEARNEGTIVSVSDGIVRIHGLADVMAGEMIELPGNAFALALNLERDSVGAVVLGDYEHLREGDTVKTTGRILEVPTGRELLGRVVDALGNPIDGKGPIQATERKRVDVKAPGIIPRKSVNEPMATGLKAIDALIPIGRGQRELIIGDRQTGKTAVILDTFLNQKPAHAANASETDKLYCIYVAIGQKRSTVAQFVKVLEDNGALEYS